ncbi:MAG: 3-methyladenine DNA glycosylase [Epsilonproteobacteria bacterium]|nr:3-methyladenine DNA glycosylase [Campylobacterota bacterium]
MHLQLLHKEHIVNSSDELFEVLYEENLLKGAMDPFWWPQSGSFEVIVGAILTQQTKWQKVERSLDALRSTEMLDLVKIAECDVKVLAALIKPSGFYNTKAKRLKGLCKAIVERFESFENFVSEVDREWLLAQKGIGQESADAILCYACKRAVMVCDSNTDKLLKSLGYSFESYDEMQEWMVYGVESNLEKIYGIYKDEIDVFTIYSHFHGMITEFSKSKKDIEEIFNAKS